MECNHHREVLTELKDQKDLLKLRNFYLNDWPKNCVGFYCLNNFIKWLEKQPQMKNLKIFTIDNDDDGIYIIVDRYQLFVGSLSEKSCNRILNALSELDWSIGFKVSSMLERYRPVVMDIVRMKDLKLEYDSLTLMYYITKEEIKKLKVDCPNGYYVKALNAATDAEIINDLWPNRHQGSLFLIRRLIEWNTNMGVYKTDTNELVAWCLRLQGGFLGALQVKNEYKRLGLGAVVTCAISLQLALQGEDVMALVNETNQPSRALFEKLGFKMTERCYWIRPYPTLKNYSWPDGE